MRKPTTNRRRQQNLGTQHTGLSSVRNRQSAIGNRQCLESLESRMMLTVFTVTNTADSGVGSLRWAIDQSNAVNGFDTIAFNIPGPDRVIHTQSELPGIYDPALIDGTTQPGYAGRPLVQIEGSAAPLTSSGADPTGIKLFGSSTVKGLSITGMRGSAFDTLPRPDRNFTGNTIQQCWIGVDLNGNLAPNRAMGVALWTGGNLIGGPNKSDGNVISGSRDGQGIYNWGPNNGGNIIQNNLIGTDPTGTLDYGNFKNGVFIADAPNTQIINNVISGNGDDGIFLNLENSKNNIIQGNIIGLDITGTKAISNGLYGMEVQTWYNTIGGDLPSQRNIISANKQAGIVFWGGYANYNTVVNNYIGTDITGTKALGNTYQGIAFSGGNYNTIRANVISGNGTEGIGIFPGWGETIVGNTIGASATGAPLGNGAWGISVINGAKDITIGGTVKGSGNLIANNAKDGIYIGEQNTVVTNNTITNNGGDGVIVAGHYSNRIEANSIYNNAKLGINLGWDGVSPNDVGDADDGPNGAQNFPVLSSASSDASTTNVQGTLNSIAGKAYNICFYASPTADPSGYGEGKTYLGSVSVTTNSSGNASFNPSFAAATPSGYVITATATDPAGNTSEFSQAKAVSGTTPPPAPAYVQFSSATYQVNENGGSATITVTRTGNTAIASSVGYATSNGTAIAPGDYTAASGVLSFAAGETSKTFTVPIIDDTTVEPTETVNLALSNPSNATLGSTAAATLSIADNDVAPAYIQFNSANYQVNENGGSATITLTRTGNTNIACSVNYATSNGTAIAPGDYTASSGTISFAAGETSKTFAVPIIDDTTVEPTETVNLALSNAVGASLGSTTAATLSIADNDVAPAPTYVQFSSSAYQVAENGGAATITVTRTGNTAVASSVLYATSDGTAVAPGDYTATWNVLNFAAGETSKTFTVSIVDDTTVEPTETVNLTLSNATGAILGATAAATLSIADNDVAPPAPAYVQFSSAVYQVNENAGNVAITVTRTGDTNLACSVAYATGDNSATAPSDYTATSGVLSFGAGETSKTFYVPIIDDTAVEMTEAINLSLSSPSNATLGSTPSATITIFDNDTVVTPPPTDSTPPQVVWGRLTDDYMPNIIQFKFTEDVSKSLSTADVVVTDLTHNQVIPTRYVSWDSRNLTANVWFKAILPDARFRVVLNAAGVNDAAGNKLASSYTFNCLHLTGDANHDGAVNKTDRAIMLANWGRTKAVYSQGDFNYDRRVNQADADILAKNWYRTLPAAPATPAVAPATFSTTPLVSRKTSDLLK